MNHRTYGAQLRNWFSHFLPHSFTSSHKKLPSLPLQPPSRLFCLLDQDVAATRPWWCSRLNPSYNDIHLKLYNSIAVLEIYIENMIIGATHPNIKRPNTKTAHLFPISTLLSNYHLSLSSETQTPCCASWTKLGNDFERLDVKSPTLFSLVTKLKEPPLCWAA